MRREAYRFTDYGMRIPGRTNSRSPDGSRAGRGKRTLHGARCLIAACPTKIRVSKMESRFAASLNGLLQQNLPAGDIAGLA